MNITVIKLGWVGACMKYFDRVLTEFTIPSMSQGIQDQWVVGAKNYNERGTEVAKSKVLPLIFK